MTHGGDRREGKGAGDDQGQQNIHQRKVEKSPLTMALSAKVENLREERNGWVFHKGQPSKTEYAPRIKYGGGAERCS